MFSLCLLYKFKKMDTNKQEFKQKLERLLEIKSKTEVAAHFSISRQALYKWFKKFDIDYKSYQRFRKPSTDFKKLSDKADELLNQ